MTRRESIKAAVVGAVAAQFPEGARADEFVEDVKWLRLEPNDILVVKTQMFLSKANADNIAVAISKAVPGHKVIVLEGGMSLEVVKQL